jgi:hypothetical protein
MIPNFLDTPKIMVDENLIYYVAPSQNFHLLGLLKNKHSEELNFPTLFHKQFRQFFEGFSYELLPKSRDFQQIFLTFFFKLLKFPSKKS